MSRASWIAHFGLSAAPFAKDVEDGRLWLPSEREGVVSELVDAVREHQHVLLAGEPGVGKTCALRAVRHRLPEAGFRLTYCHNATLGRRDFYRQLCLSLGLAPKATAASIFYAINTHVEELGRERRHPVFLLDEAHLLHQDVLDLDSPTGDLHPIDSRPCRAYQAAAADGRLRRPQLSPGVRRARPVQHSASAPEGVRAIHLFMLGKTEELLAAALGLPASDRASLAGALLRSLDGEEFDEQTSPGEVEAAWAEELKRRAEDLRSGRVATVPWEQVRQQLEDSISRRGG